MTKPKTQDLATRDPGALPAALAEVGVQVVEKEGVRAIIFPEELGQRANILMPTQEVTQAVDLIRPSVRAVKLNPDPGGPHFYNQGTRRSPRLAPTKQALEALAFTAGVHLARSRAMTAAELTPYGEGAIGFEAVVRIRRPDGSSLEISRSKVWQMNVEWQKVKAAVARRDNAPTGTAFEREVEKLWLQEREFAPAKTESKAVLRAIRAALQIPHTFTPEQVALPFVVVGYDLALDYADPEVVKLLLDRQLDRVDEAYGTAELPAAVESSVPARNEETVEEPVAKDTPKRAFRGAEPPEPESEPAPSKASTVVLGDEFTRYAGKTVADVAEAGDTDYLEWLASDAVDDEEVREAAAEALS